jgi:hypothetical protein
MDIRVAFERTERGYAQAAVFADTGKIIAHQIDDHDVFRPVLAACLKFGGKSGIFLRSSPARTCAFDGFRLRGFAVR